VKIRNRQRDSPRNEITNHLKAGIAGVKGRGNEGLGSSDIFTKQITERRKSSWIC
jgi:hypothetical protein